MNPTNAASFYSAPNIPIQIKSQPVQSTLSGQIKQLVDSVAGHLAPQDAFTQKLPYDQYAAPMQAFGNDFINNQLRPEFNFTTFNPFVKSLQDKGAALNMGQQGTYQDYAKRLTSGVEQPFYNQALDVSNQISDATRNQYNQQLQNYYSSPSAFTNLTKQ